MKNKLILIIKLILAVVFLYWLFSSGKLPFSELSKLASFKGAYCVGIAGLLFIVTQSLAAKRLEVLLRQEQAAPTFSQVFKVTFIGAFFNQLLLGATGGDVAKGFYLYQAMGKKNPENLILLLWDRVIGLIAMAFTGLMAALYLRGGVVDPQYQAWLDYLCIGVVVGVTTAVILILAVSHRKAHDLVRLIPISESKQQIVSNIMTVSAFVTKHPGSTAYALLLSILIQLLAIAGILSLTWGLGIDVPVVGMAASILLVLLIASIPVSFGNIGWTEFVGSTMLTFMGTQDGALIMVMWRVVSVLFSLPGLIFWLSWRKKAEGEAEANRA